MEFEELDNTDNAELPKPFKIILWPLKLIFALCVFFGISQFVYYSFNNYESVLGIIIAIGVLFSYLTITGYIGDIVKKTFSRTTDDKK